MKAAVKNGVLCLEIPLTGPTESKSGKTMVIATTSGFQQPASLKYEGKQVSISLNAVIPK